MEAVEDRIEADIAERRFLRISGWMLTPTEARLYALAAVS